MGNGNTKGLRGELAVLDAAGVVDESELHA